MWRTSFRSSRSVSGSLLTNRSVRRMTPILKLLRVLRPLAAERDLDAAAADVDDRGLPALDVDAVDRGEVNQARFLGARR